MLVLLIISLLFLFLKLAALFIIKVLKKLYIYPGIVIKLLKTNLIFSTELELSLLVDIYLNKS